MNIKTTLVLIVLVGLLLGAWALFLRGGPGEVREGFDKPFFESFLPSDADEIRIQDAGGLRVKEPVLFTRGAGGWEVTSASLENGRPVRAKARVVQDVLEAVQALAPLRMVTEDANAQEEQELGIGVRDCLTITVSGKAMEPLSLTFGAELGPGEVTCRASSRPEIFAVPKEALRSLAPEARDAEDPALLRLEVLDVKTIAVERDGSRVLSVERGHSRWFMSAPIDGVPADAQRCERLRSAALSLAIRKRLWDADPAEVFKGEAPWRITVGTATGKSHTVVLGGAHEKLGVTARLDDREPIVVVSDDILALLGGDLGRYRDRRPLDVPNARVAMVKVENKQGPDLTLQRFNQSRFKILLPDREMPAVTLFADEVDASAYLAGLRGIHFTRFGTEEPLFEPELVVTVSSASAGAQKLTEQAVAIGPATDGERPLRVVGQPGLGYVTDESVAFLKRPYWELLERRAKCTDAYFKVGRLEVTSSEGTVSKYVGRIPGFQQDLILAREDGDVLVDVRPDAKERLITAMTGGFAVDSWLGEGARPEMGFDKPYLLVRWFEPKGATNAGIPQTDEGEWNALVIGRRKADGKYYAMIEDGKLDLAFILDPIHLAMFTDLK